MAAKYPEHAPVLDSLNEIIRGADRPGISAAINVIFAAVTIPPPISHDVLRDFCNPARSLAGNRVPGAESTLAST